VDGCGAARNYIAVMGTGVDGAAGYPHGVHAPESRADLRRRRSVHMINSPYDYDGVRELKRRSYFGGVDDTGSTEGYL
jgi:hypothetical protein